MLTIRSIVLVSVKLTLSIFEKMAVREPVTVLTMLRVFDLNSVRSLEVETASVRLAVRVLGKFVTLLTSSVNVNDTPILSVNTSVRDPVRVETMLRLLDLKSVTIFEGETDSVIGWVRLRDIVTGLMVG